MELLKPEILAEHTDIYGCEYILAKDEENNRFILESFSMASLPMEKTIANLIRDMEERIQAVSEIGHPGFIGYLGVARYQGRLFMVLPGADELWEQLTERTKPDLSPGRVRKGLSAGLDMLSSLHKAGLTAMGISCRELVWYPKDDTLKIIDPEPGWLLASYRKEKNNFRFTPEYIKKMSWTFPSDIFAFGAAYYQWLTGSYPFFTEKEEEISTQVLRAKPLDLRYYLPAIGAPLSLIFREMMAKEESRRPGEGDLIAQLASLPPEKIAASPAEREKFSRKSKRAVAGRIRSRRLGAFWRMRKGVFMICMVAVGALLGIHYLQPRLRPAITEKTTPAQVMGLYFASIEQLNHAIMREIATEDGAGDLFKEGNSNMIRSISNMHVQYTMRRLGGNPGPMPLTVMDLKLREVFRDARTCKFKADYRLRIEWGKTRQIQLHSDIFVLVRKNRLWRITKRDNNYSIVP
ncbi:MAG: hypothetical protein ACM3WV_04210 [Bacillota bacterium]